MAGSLYENSTLVELIQIGKDTIGEGQALPDANNYFLALQRALADEITQVARSGCDETRNAHINIAMKVLRAKGHEVVDSHILREMELDFKDNLAQYNLTQKILPIERRIQILKLGVGSQDVRQQLLAKVKLDIDILNSNVSNDGHEKLFADQLLRLQQAVDSIDMSVKQKPNSIGTKIKSAQHHVLGKSKVLNEIRSDLEQIGDKVLNGEELSNGDKSKLDAIKDKLESLQDNKHVNHDKLDSLRGQYDNICKQSSYQPDSDAPSQGVS